MAIHGSVRVEFVPNLESRAQLDNFRWGKCNPQLTRKNCQIDQIKSHQVSNSIGRFRVLLPRLRFGWIHRDLAGSIKIQPKVRQISKDLDQISILDKISINLRERERSGLGMVVFGERPLVDLVSVGFQNAKLSLKPQPSGFDIGDLLSTASCSD